MLLKQKKKLLYVLSMVFGLALTVFAVQKDSDAKHELKHELAACFSLPVAEADTPNPPSRGDDVGGDGDDDDGGDGDGDDGDGGDDGDDGDGDGGGGGGGDGCP